MEKLTIFSFLYIGRSGDIYECSDLTVIAHYTQEEAIEMYKSKGCYRRESTSIRVLDIDHNEDTPRVIY